MKTAQKNLMIRVIKRHMQNGETFEQIMKRYPKISDEDKEMLRKAVGADKEN